MTNIFWLFVLTNQIFGVNIKSTRDWSERVDIHAFCSLSKLIFRPRRSQVILTLKEGIQFSVSYDRENNSIAKYVGGNIPGRNVLYNALCGICCL